MRGNREHQPVVAAAVADAFERRNRRQQVFATAAFAWFGDAVTCMAGDHGTPLVTMTSLPSTVLDTGDDNIILANFMWEEAMRSSVRVLDEAGELDGFERLGVFGPLEPGMQEAVDDGLEPAARLNSRGGV